MIPFDRLKDAVGEKGFSQDPAEIAPHLEEWRSKYKGSSPLLLKPGSAEERAAFWTAAVEKARSLWGESWGIAYNGEMRRTQCHAHAHIGKLNEEVEMEGFVLVATPAEIQLPTGTCTSTGCSV